MKFSVIIPTYNVEKYLQRCLNNLAGQLPGDYEKEALLIDDCSSDNTYCILREFGERNKAWVKIYRNKQNRGPGITRNVGIDNATGDWLVFLDSDDALFPDALKELSEYIHACGRSLDIIGYNWIFDPESKVRTERYGGRWDLDSLAKSKGELIRDYISLGMDGSIVYTAMRKELLDVHGLRIRDGLHEDVDFLFKVYFYALSCGILDRPLYVKNNREMSIINSISERHIKGFLRALDEIAIFLESKNMFMEKVREYFYQGVLRLIATEVRGIRQGHGMASEAAKLYDILYNEYLDLLTRHPISIPKLNTAFETKYMMIANYFLGLMANDRENAARTIAEFLDMINDKSWSCYDLHHSLFFAPSEIRTCCKRFFVDNKMKGDVILIDEKKCGPDGFTPENILKAKKKLYVRINRGMAEECRGCPHLTFRTWELIDELKVEYISFEHCTICNMRCIYCSDMYYGGKKAKYNVKQLARRLVETGSLRSCKAIVWGGGEPILDASFNELLPFMAANFPDIKQRVFTNATGYSDLLAGLLDEDKVLLITSVDAGNEETFYKMRKHRGLERVLANLRCYAAVRPENMIIKYIATDYNSSLSDLKLFTDRVSEYALEKCNFQISVDFKNEFVAQDAIISAIALHAYLSELNVRFVFFDDLFWQRITQSFDPVSDRTLNEISEIRKLQLLKAFADKDRYERVVIWGAGFQARALIEKSLFFKKVKIEYLVDDASDKIGTDFIGHKVFDPKVLLDSDLPVIVAAVQNTPIILKRFYKMGLPESRLIKGLVI